MNLKFAPTPKESVQIAIPNSMPILRESCIKLGISNIRILKKIENLVEKIKPLLTEKKEQVQNHVIQYLTLFSWSFYDTKNAPSIDFLRKKSDLNNGFVYHLQEPSKQENEWHALLSPYGFFQINDLENKLLEGVKNGFFDDNLIEKFALELNNSLSWREALNRLLYSFEDNEKEVVSEITNTFLSTIKARKPYELNYIFKLLNFLGKKQDADKILDEYISTHSEERAIFNLSHDNLGTQYDSEIIQRFDKQYNSYPALQFLELHNILTRLRDPCPEDELHLLSELDISEYVKHFKKEKGVPLSDMILGCLQIDNIDKHKEIRKNISIKATEALKEIANENRLNAFRIRKYGIDISSNNSEIIDSKDKANEQQYCH